MVGLVSLSMQAPGSLPDTPAGFQPGSTAFHVEVAGAASGQGLASLLAPLTLAYQVDQSELTAAGGDASRVQLALRSGCIWLGLGCTSDLVTRVLSCDVPYAGDFAVLVSPVPSSSQDWDLANGHLFKQANGFGGAGDLGYEVVDDAAAVLWTEFQRLGGLIIGYPISGLPVPRPI
jgi:hypothetical protein